MWKWKWIMEKIRFCKTKSIFYVRTQLKLHLFIPLDIYYYHLFPAARINLRTGTQKKSVQNLDLASAYN